MLRCRVADVFADQLHQGERRIACFAAWDVLVRPRHQPPHTVREPGEMPGMVEELIGSAWGSLFAIGIVVRACLLFSLLGSAEF